MRKKIKIITLVLISLFSLIFGCKSAKEVKETVEINTIIFDDYRDKETENGFFLDFNETKFWKLIDYSLNKFPNNKVSQIDFLIEIVADREDTEIFLFNLYQNWLYYQAYTSDLWAIAYTATCGCSDESFRDYRAWLITEGKDKYYTILNSNPEKLVDLYNTTNEINGRSEIFHGFSYYVYEKKYPESIDSGWDFDDKYSKFDKSKLEFNFPEIEFNWEGIEDIRKIFPEFYKKFNTCG